MRVSVTCRLIEWRLRWWGQACGRIFLRHWQWFVLAAVLIPAGTPLRALLLFLATPIVQALQPGHGPAWYLAHLGAIELLGAAWILVQRNALAGGDFAVYLRALPLGAFQRMVADVAVLIPANTLLLAPLAAAWLTASAFGGADGGMAYARLSALALLTLQGQLALIARRPRMVLPLLLGNAALTWNLSAQGAPAAWLLLAGALGLGLHMLVAAPGVRRGARSSVTAMRRMPAQFGGVLPPVWRIQAKALATAASCARASALLAIALGANVLMEAFDFDARALPTAALALAALALVIAGWYRSLHDAQAPMAAYHRTLPWARRFWPRQDLRFVICLGLLPALAVLVPWWVHWPQRAASAAALLAGYGGLLAALRIPVLRGGRQAAILAVLTASAWSVAAVAATA